MNTDPKIVELVLNWAEGPGHDNESVRVLAAEVRALRADCDRLQKLCDPLRADRDRLQKLCDKTALAAANRVLQRDVNQGERARSSPLERPSSSS